MRTKLLLSLLSFAGALALNCGGAVSLENRPCPCADGFQCCPGSGGGVCVPLGATCSVNPGDDAGPSTGDDGGEPPPSGDSGGDAAWTIAQGSDAQLVLFPQAAFITSVVVGSSPDDLWAGGVNDGSNGLYHFDGASWTEVPLSAPVNTVAPSAWGLASAGAGAVWIAHPLAIVRVDTAGHVTDFTAQVSPDPNAFAVAIDAAPDGTAVVGNGNGRPTALFDGTSFTNMPASPTNGATNVVVNSRHDIWLGNSSDQTSNFAHFDGTSYQASSASFDWQSTGAVVPVGPGRAGLDLGTEALVCPGWCHPQNPPYGQSIIGDWTAQIAQAADGGVQTNPVSIPPPPDLDPSLGYTGLTIALAKSGKVALIGCVFDQQTFVTGADTGRYVVHEWDGTAQTPRPLSSNWACPDWVPSHAIGRRPLLDGTWVLPADGGAGIVLMTP